MATIFFGSNKVVKGTTGNDSIIGNDPEGNIHDIIYGHQGDDSITTQHGLFDSTVYGGQGNDRIFDGDPTQARTSGGNVIYGNLGNDSIFLGIMTPPSSATRSTEAKATTAWRALILQSLMLSTAIWGTILYLPSVTPLTRCMGARAMTL